MMQDKISVAAGDGDTIRGVLGGSARSVSGPIHTIGTDKFGNEVNKW